MAQMFDQGVGVDQPGGVFIRPANQMDDNGKTLLFTVARVVLIAARGNLAQQLANLAAPPVYPPALPKITKVREEVSAELPFMELPYFNGIGALRRTAKST